MHYITSQTLFRIKVLLLTGTLVIVAIVLVDIFMNDAEPGLIGRKKSKTPKGEEEFKMSDELLHARLWQLQDLDQKFASLMTTQYDEEALVKTNASIQYAEESFRKSIDSIARVGATYDETSGSNDFQNMTTFFKKDSGKPSIHRIHPHGNSCKRAGLCKRKTNNSQVTK